MALKDVIKEQNWLKFMFKNISILNALYNNNIYTDSQLAIELAKNPVHYERTKHIDIQYHYVRDSVIEKHTQLNYIPTKLQLADALTKAVSNKKWQLFTKEIGLKEKEL